MKLLFAYGRKEYGEREEDGVNNINRKDVVRMMFSSLVVKVLREKREMFKCV